jgi:hypothetical protein
MVPQLIFSQLVLSALVRVFLLLYWLWPSDHAARGQAIAMSESTQHRRSREPKPFAGLTHKPLCAACEQKVTDPKPPSAAPPEPMSPTNRRRVRSIPRGTFVPMTAVDIVASWRWATCVPM